MASLATCPLCAKQLAVPKEASADDRAQCPECDATFLLSSTFQVALPMLRLLAPSEEEIEEPPEEAAAAIQPRSLSDFSPVSENKSPAEEPKQSSSETAAVESLSSWEARLKKAIERDSSDLAGELPSKKELDAKEDAKETAAPTPAPAAFIPQPEFEFQLDSTPAEMPHAAEIESAKEAAQVNLLAARDAQSFAEELEITETAEIAPTVAVTKKPERHLNTSPARPTRGFSPLKVAAALLGPGVVGIFLGLYALLWIKGPGGDVMNLAHYLPTSMLPYAESVEEMPANEMDVAGEMEQLLADSPPQENLSVLSEPLPSEPEPQPQPPRRDETVQLATAEEPLPPATISLPASFSQLLAAAQTAQPGLIEGDLSNNAAVAQKGQAYMAVCRLAQEIEWIREPSLDANSQTQIAAAQAIFDGIATEGSALRDLASIVSRWWGYEARPNQGIFLVGQIRNVQPLGGQTLCYVALDEPSTATVIPVLLDRPPAQGASRILVVGKIVAQPQSNLQGFAVDLPQVVVAPYSRTLQP